MDFKYDPKELTKMAKKRVKNNPKKSATKGIKRVAISIAAMAIAGVIVVFLNKAGIEISAEDKAEIVKYLIQIMAGGAALSFATFFGLDATKKRYSNEEEDTDN